MKKEITLIVSIVVVAFILSFLSYYPVSLLGFVMKFDTTTGDCVDYEDSNYYNLKYQKGKLVYNGAEYEDICVNERFVKEYYCSKYGYLVKKNIACAYDEVCVDGECVSSLNSVFLIVPYTSEYYENLIDETEFWLEENTEKNYYVSLEEDVPFKKDIIILGDPCDYEDKVKSIFIDKIDWSCDEQIDLINKTPEVGIYWRTDLGNRQYEWIFNVSLERVYNLSLKEKTIYFITENETKDNLARNSSECLSIDLDNNNFIDEEDDKLFDDRYALWLLKACGVKKECEEIDYNGDREISGYDWREFNKRYEDNEGQRCEI